MLAMRWAIGGSNATEGGRHFAINQAIAHE